MPESLRRIYERYFSGEDGTPNVGLIIASLIVACVVLGVMWQVAFGRSAGEEQSSSSPSEQNVQEDVSGSSDGSSSEGSSGSGGGPNSGGSGGEGLSAVCDTFANQEEANISTEQKDAAEVKAGEFVETVYGYTGTDAETYEASVEEMTVGECFNESATAEEVAQVSEVARQGGEENAPSDRNFLEEFVGLYVNGEEQVESGSETIQVVYGEAVWVSRRVGGESTTGQEAFNAYQESLTLAKKAGSEEEWKIVEGQGAYDYTDGYYADAVDETIQELQNSAEEPGGETTAPESTEGFMEETTAPATNTTDGLTNSGQ